MFLTITSLQGIEYEGGITSLNIKTTSGEITVLDHHRPLVTVLAKGVAHVLDERGEKRDFDIASGFLEVTPDNKVHLLIN